MQFGLNPVQSDPTFGALVRQVTLAEAVGFDAVWTYEHHSRSARTYADPLLSLAVVAGHTERITLGTNMVLLPLHHPVDVAERAAMVDALSGGRLVLGVAAGYAPHEFAAFGVPLRERGARMEHGIQAIRDAWRAGRAEAPTDDEADAYALFPPPVQDPGPPIYVGGLSRGAIRRAARLGDGYVVSSGTPADQVAARIAYYQEALHAAGSGAARLPVALNRIMHVTRDAAGTRHAEELFGRRFLAIYGHLGHGDIKAMGGRDQSYEELSREHFIIGEPGRCVELVHRYAELGVGHLACLMNFGEPDVEAVEESMRRFSDRVLPECAAL